MCHRQALATKNNDCSFFLHPFPSLTPCSPPPPILDHLMWGIEEVGKDKEIQKWNLGMEAVCFESAVYINNRNQWRSILQAERKVLRLIASRFLIDTTVSFWALGTKQKQTVPGFICDHGLREITTQGKPLRGAALECLPFLSSWASNWGSWIGGT